jgi:large subunit ribosomal protein L25
MAGTDPRSNRFGTDGGQARGAARQSRREGKRTRHRFSVVRVEPLPINIPFNKLFSLLKAGRF